MVYIGIKKTWSPALSLASRSEAPENCPVCRNEQRRSPTPICIYVPSSTYWKPRCTDTPMAGMYGRAVYNIPKGHSPLLCFWQTFWNFLRISERQNQSVVNALYYVSPTLPLCKGQSIGVGQYKNRNLYWFFKFILPILCYTILQKIHFYLHLSPQKYRAIVPKRGTSGSFADEQADMDGDLVRRWGESTILQFNNKW